MAVGTRTVYEDEGAMRLERWFKAYYPALPCVSSVGGFARLPSDENTIMSEAIGRYIVIHRACANRVVNLRLSNRDDAEIRTQKSQQKNPCDLV